MASLTLAGLSSVERPGGFAVRDIDLLVPHGTVCALVGPSGSGKTTLLRLIAGIDAVAAGSIHLGDADITDTAPGERDIALVSAEHALYPHLDVEDNIGFALRLKRRLRRDIDERVHTEARVTGVEHLLHRMPNTLAAGERQAAGLARATARLPQACLLDEPLAQVDPQHRTRLRAELTRFLHALDAPTILATNDQTDALALGDQLAVLRDGCLVQSGPPAELLDRPGEVFVATFLGNPGMNVLPGVLEVGRRASWIRLGDGAIPLPRLPPRVEADFDGRTVLLGVRPEHLRFTDREGASAVTGLTERVERLGHVHLVHARLADGTGVVVRTSPDRRVEPGASVCLRLDPAHAHLFDPATRQAHWHGADHPTE